MRVEILLVEDDFVLNLELRETLELFGYLVESVYCPDAAIEALSRRQYLSALITDIDLGVGLDGFGVASRARAAYPDLPVVFISGSRAADHHVLGVAGSVFIAKPFHPNQIAAALEQLIHPEAAQCAAIPAPTDR